MIVAPAATGQNTNGITYKTTASADSVVPYQNLVYGFPANQLDFTSTYPAFQFARSLSIGCFNDWYIPAQNELEILYYNLKPNSTANLTGSGSNPNAVPARASNYTASVPGQTTSTLFQTGGAQAFFTANNYWSSSEDSSLTGNAWTQSFNNGNQGIVLDYKNTNYYARAIRRVAA